MYVTNDRVLKLGYFETKCYGITKLLHLSLLASNKKNKTNIFRETCSKELYKDIAMEIELTFWISNDFLKFQ